MWEPVGPLPASVYWRRRWIAIASTVLVVVALVWTVAAAVGGRGAEPAVRPATHAALSAPQEVTPPPAAPQAPGPAAVPGPQAPLPGVAEPAPPPVFELPAPTPGAAVTSDPAQTAQPSTAQPSTTQSSTTQPLTEQLTQDPTTPPATPTPATSEPPAEPIPCTNAMLGVGAEVERPEHRVGERALLRLVVTNIGDRPCVRDLDAVRQEVVVWSEDLAQRLWSSNDCSRASGADPRTLEPGQPVVFSVRWAGRTSEPGCPADRTVVPAGSYKVMTRVDDVISAPTPFRRLP